MKFLDNLYNRIGDKLKIDKIQGVVILLIVIIVFHFFLSYLMKTDYKILMNYIFYVFYFVFGVLLILEIVKLSWSEPIRTEKELSKSETEIYLKKEFENIIKIKSALDINTSDIKDKIIKEPLKSETKNNKEVYLKGEFERLKEQLKGLQHYDEETKTFDLDFFSNVSEGLLGFYFLYCVFKDSINPKMNISNKSIYNLFNEYFTLNLTSNGLTGQNVNSFKKNYEFDKEKNTFYTYLSKNIKKFSL
ncbi:hypothetical protein LNJ06_00565 [Tenacibaculum finnmarkense genomovar ulcerans]|uniref:hypothetical protein n=1 Tax=Tenacibaculum finnmarkense TaxID=2781243 RepID=UPI001E47F824|nr:hypothetical protein [Tenacibaculum finnmarkense]MCD8428681.1 hypothetical protein [Tenacibaculum finnmarkense genomovar ulcerans]MCG8732474.1 hypothetical protein [Tenacibaculum finnmarkense]